MKKIAFILAVIIVFLTGAAGVYYYRLNHLGPVRFVNSEDSREKAKRLGQRLQGLALVPAGETPVLATVLDINKLKDRPLFANAQNGDVVLMYAASKKAILYRESIGKIIDIGPVTVDNTTPPPTEASLKVAIYNSSKIPALVQPVRDVIQKNIPSAYFVQESTATNSYGKNLVIDLTGKKGQLAAQIAGLLGGEVTVLPPGEEKPAADLLVIIGK